MSSEAKASVSNRPWSSERERLLQEHERDPGYDPEYDAWRSWIGTKLDTFYPLDCCWEAFKGFDDMDEGGKIALYCIMCELVDGACGVQAGEA